MQQYTEDQFLEKYASLPQELKTAMSSIESSDIIQAISKKFGLQIDQMGELASETGFVLLGFTKPEEYIKNLKNRLQIDPQKAKEIALEINSQIFSKVKESLKRLHGIGGEEKKETETKTPASSPLELIKKHEDETTKKPENKKEEKEIEKTKDAQTPPANPSFINIMPDLKDIPEQELKNQILPVGRQVSRYAKQTTEIKLPDEKEKNIHFKNEHYPEGDPYKEPI